MILARTDYVNHADDAYASSRFPTENPDEAAEPWS